MVMLICTCGKTYYVDEKEVGDEYVCRQCFAVLKVPSASGPPPAAGDDGYDAGRSLAAIGGDGYGLATGDDIEASPAPAPQRRLPLLPAAAAAGALLLALVGFLLGRRNQPATVIVAPPPVPESVPAAGLSATAGELPTGTHIEPPAAATGRSRLTLVNGTDRDAVVKLCGPGAIGPLRRRLYRYVYVANHDSTTLQGIAPGAYDVLFSLGQGWDPNAKRFRERTCSRFDQPIRFEERVTQTELRYSTQRLTLHRVAGGNVRTQEIPDEEFDSIR